ncbi:hypothetical protein OQZ29_13360 [Pedobacter agri]|uniref:GNAT family N-acetyltransferase n=1 Tax=Pedobacter agri TaxID=454586 RepID=A0A9X3IA68_9SPHI|nr:hypothetical protein [Pedobacter agri]MCX3265739.1 hypothetical protein [Pedobacter agri]
MQIEVKNSQPSDIDAIFDFYDIAIAHQKKVFNKHWQGFSRDLVQTEIEEDRQYKILVDGKNACVLPLPLPINLFGAIAILIPFTSTGL